MRDDTDRIVGLVGINYEGTAQKAAELALQASHTQASHTQAAEVAVRLQATVARLDLEVKERQRFEQELRHQAMHDTLTGLPNRALLMDRIEQAIELARRHDHSLKLLFLDLDRFKLVNDSLGHAARGKLLCVVTRRISRLVRSGDTVARLGGDEFVLLLPETEGGTALAIAKDVQARFAVATESMEITLSIGCAVGPLRDGDFLPILKQADEALYSSKRLGRNRITLAGSQQHQSALRSIDSDDVSRPAKVIYRS